MTNPPGGSPVPSGSPDSARVLLEWAEAGRERIAAYERAIAAERALVDGWERRAGQTPGSTPPAGVRLVMVEGQGVIRVLTPGCSAVGQAMRVGDTLTITPDRLTLTHDVLDPLEE